MKGFKNILAAGALGIILAATGCQNYQMPVTDPSSPLYNAGTTETTTRAPRGTRGFIMPGYSNRYAANTRKNINAAKSAGQVAKRNITNRTTNKTTRNATRTLPSGNTYQTSRATGAARNTVTALNKDYLTSNRGSYGRQNQYVPTRTNTRYGTNTGSSYTRNTRNTRNTYNTGNVTQFPAANRTNRTGSPFGDYNKDRAYSLTRNTGVTGGNINAASRINNVADNAAHTANTTRGTVVRKSFTQGKEITHTASDNSVIKTGTANKMTRSNAASPTKLTNTKTKKTETKKTRAAATAGKTVNNTAKNTAATAKKAAQPKAAVTTKQATVNNTAKTTNNAAVNNATKVNNTAINNTAVNNTAVNNAGTAINRNTGAQSFNAPINRINGARSASINRVVETEAYNEINDAHLPPTRIKGINVKRQNPNAVAARNRANAARTNNMNNRKRFTTANRGIGSYNYADNMYRPYGYYDNLTFDNAYRNADLRNNIYAPDMHYGYYGAGNYGTEDLASGTRSGVTRSTGTYGSSDRYGRYGGYPGYYYGSYGYPGSYYYGGNSPYYGSYNTAGSTMGGTNTGVTRSHS